MSLAEYKRKRDFGRTPEPAVNGKRAEGHRFVIQKHAASRLHYDFRLELDGTLKSWAVPKGPSLDPSVKSLAVQVEDHPIDYANFEGVIPQGQYGGGTVMVWDRGTWVPEGNASKDLKRGKLSFELHGEKLSGRWSLVRMGSRAGSDGKNWLLIKSDDKAASKRQNILTSEPNSVLSGREMKEIATAKDKVWQSKSKSKSNASQKRMKSKPRSTRQASNGSVSQLPGAIKKPLPKEFKPQLATLGSSVPQGENWLHEMKFDGYRILAFFDKGRIRLITRNGNDWTRKFPTVVKELSKLKLDSAILDGEVVSLDEHGLPNFQLLQNLLKRGDDSETVFYLFDVPYFSNYLLTKTPLINRKLLLENILANYSSNNGVIRYSEHIEGQGASVLANACKLKMEGVVSKQRDSGYLQARSPAWIKSKCTKRQEFVIGGFTRPTGSRVGFGALLLGYYEGDQFIYAGRVGTGFNNTSLRQLHRSLKKIKRETSPFSKGLSRAESRGVTWVTPELVAEVEFTEWTNEGLLRHPSFQSLREDKPAKQITCEVPKLTKRLQTKANKSVTVKDSNKAADEADSVVAGVAITHPDRVLYPEQGFTKRDLAEYYESVADWVLPYVIGRPLTMVRCPQGRKGKCFFQKHLTDSMPDTLEGVVINKGEGEYVVVNDLSGLVSLVQMGVLEIHLWGSRIDNLEKPDQIVFDLDPGPGVEWSELIDAARHLRKLLEGQQLKSFVRTSGGKGFHVVVPLKPGVTWDEAKEFARTIAFDLQHEEPDRFVAVASKAKRKNKIFVDYLRNSRGATSVASYSTRAREGAPVAMPLRWEELGKVKSADQYTIQNVLRRLGSLRKDPWDGFFKICQSL